VPRVYERLHHYVSGATRRTDISPLLWILHLRVGKHHHYLHDGAFSGLFDRWTPVAAPAVAIPVWPVLIIAAIALTPVIVFANAWMDAVFVRIEDPRYGSLVASTVLFFIPTAILGMIAPYSVRLVVESTTTSGQVAGALYFVSTLGSALGTLMTSFYLVLWFDMNTIISVMIAALLIAGVAAMAADRFFPIEDIGNQTVTNPMEANA